MKVRGNYMFLEELGERCKTGTKSLKCRDCSRPHNGSVAATCSEGWQHSSLRKPRSMEQRLLGTRII